MKGKIARVWYLVPLAGAILAGLLAVETTFNSAPPAPAPKTADDATIKEIMDLTVDPNADYLFSSVQVVSDENGVTEKAPASDRDWQEVSRRLAVLSQVPARLTAEGRKVARPGDRSINPLVENEPEQVQALLDAYRPEFVRYAKKFQDSLGQATKAAEAKDKDAFRAALDSVDKACETCHLRYFYPNDSRAQQAAKEDGI